MRVLSIFNKSPGGKPSKRLWWELLPKLAPLCDEYTRLTYEDIWAKGQGYSGSDLMADYSPDVIILYCDANDVIPYLKDARCAKVAIVCDFYYFLPNKLWWDGYVECGIDMMFQRGVYDPKLDYPIPQVYWPFSASPDEFYPGVKARWNKVGFVGALDNPVYAQRRKAIEALLNSKLVLVCADYLDGAYPGFLRRCVAGLTSTQVDGAPPLHAGDPKPATTPPSPYARTFEIMASGTALLTPPFMVQEELFPGGVGCFFYGHDCSDIVQVAQDIIHNPLRTREVALAGYNYFLHHHTDEIRIRELYDHLVRLVEGRQIERQWGI